MPMTTAELIHVLQSAAGDCQHVIDNWESGDLASAVNRLTSTKEALEDGAKQFNASLPFIAVHATPDGPTVANTFGSLDAAREWCRGTFDEAGGTVDGELPDEICRIYRDGDLVEEVLPEDRQQDKGWILATVLNAGASGENVLEIERDDAAGVFESDADAVDHVMHLACREADPEARAAIREIVESWNQAN